MAVFGSHPPGDLAFREELMRVAVGSWHVEVGGRERAFRVTYANTFDEPVGGLMNVILAEDGQHYKRTDVNWGRAFFHMAEDQQSTALPVEEMNDLVSHMTALLERMQSGEFVAKGRPDSQSRDEELSETFLASISQASKPGVRLE